MPRLLIFGATGYLGSQVVHLLVQSGHHTVYGIARTPEKAKMLAKQEVIPVLCPDPANHPEQYLKTIRSCSIDIVVDLAKAIHDSYSFLENGPKLGFIYCSGTWVHGSSTKPVTDLDLVGPGAETPPETLVSWRVDLENTVLNSEHILDIMILRPSLIYGSQSNVWTNFLTPILEAGKNKSAGPIEILLEARSRTGLIHVDDAASAFMCAIEKLPMIAGTSIYPVFDLVTSQESMRDIFDAVATCWGYQGEVKLIGHGENPVSRGVSVTFRGSSARAKQLLGWQPKRLDGFVKDMDIYAAA